MMGLLLWLEVFVRDWCCIACDGLGLQQMRAGCQ